MSRVNTPQRNGMIDPDDALMLLIPQQGRCQGAAVKLGGTRTH